MKKAIGAAVLATGVLVSAAAAQYRDRDDQYDHRYDDRQDERYRPHIRVFVDDDFRGQSMVIDRPIARLGPTGMEDTISSIGVDGGAWQICEDDDFQGRCIIIDRSIGRLDRLGMDDEISSIRPVPPRRYRY